MLHDPLSPGDVANALVGGGGVPQRLRKCAGWDLRTGAPV